MEKVLEYFERKRQEFNQIRSLPWNSDMRDDWIERRIINGLQNGNPDWALDSLSWTDTFTHDEWNDPQWRARYEEATSVMGFLEKEFHREGQAHRFEDRYP